MHLVGSLFRRACHPHAHVMVAVVAVCRNALVGTGWSNSCLVCTNRLRKHYSHLVRSSNTTLMHLVGSLLRRACHPHVHVMVAVVIVCRNALVGTGWSNSCLVCTNRLRKHYYHLVGSSSPRACHPQADMHMHCGSWP